MAEARRVEKTYQDSSVPTPANRNRPPLRVVQGGNTTPVDSTRNISVQTSSTNADRNVRKKNNTYVGQQDIATQFNESYAKQGLQPQGIGGGASAATAGEAAPRPQYQQPAQLTRSNQTQSKRRGLVPKKVSTAVRRNRLKKHGIARRASAKVRATSVNIWVWSWGLWSWLIFQLPFAILSVVFMVLAEFVYQLFVERSLFKATNPSGWEKLYWIFVDGVLSAVLTVAEVVIALVKNWLGIDLTLFHPGALFLLTYTLVIAFGWFTLLLIYFMYSAAFLRPLTGNGQSIKITMFLVAFIGYTIPVANIFPWFIFWTMAVWWYPK